MSPPEIETCATCKYMRVVEAGAVTKPTIGPVVVEYECRCLPPPGGRLDKDDKLIPIVRPVTLDYWCGQYKKDGDEQ